MAVQLSKVLGNCTTIEIRDMKVLGNCTTIEIRDMDDRLVNIPSPRYEFHQQDKIQNVFVEPGCSDFAVWSQLWIEVAVKQQVLEIAHELR